MSQDSRRRDKRKRKRRPGFHDPNNRRVDDVLPLHRRLRRPRALVCRVCEALKVPSLGQCRRLRFLLSIPSATCITRPKWLSVAIRCMNRHLSSFLMRLTATFTFSFANLSFTCDVRCELWRACLREKHVLGKLTREVAGHCPFHGFP